MGEELSELVGAGLFFASIVASATQPWSAWRSGGHGSSDSSPDDDADSEA